MRQQGIENKSSYPHKLWHPKARIFSTQAKRPQSNERRPIYCNVEDWAIATREIESIARRSPTPSLKSSRTSSCSTSESLSSYSYSNSDSSQYVTPESFHSRQSEPGLLRTMKKMKAFLSRFLLS